MKLDPALITEVRERTDIVAVVGEHVRLRRAGANHTGLCPFHPEKTPSFNVNAVKQFFYCFGCQKSGDVIRFLQDLEGKTFMEVVEDLARRAGVALPEETPEQRQRHQQAQDERSRLLRVCDLACAWYESQLAQDPRAAAYLQERGVNNEVRQRFRLGYAPDRWDGLLGLLAQRKVPHELAELAGLLVAREDGEVRRKGQVATPRSHYDRFRGRLMFPLLTPAGEVVAFGGRVLPGGEAAKYINSPETPLYKKGDHLYGLHAARDSIRKQRQVILVEGNFDVLSLHQHGLGQTVAPMGTALTDHQVQVLKRLLGGPGEGQVLLMMDGDRAGHAATHKDIGVFSAAQVDVRVVQLPDGEDPDTYVVRDRAGLEQRLRAARPAVDFVLEEAVRRAQHDTVAGKVAVIQAVAPLLHGVRGPAQDLYIAKLAGALAVEEQHVRRHLRGDRQPDESATIEAPKPATVDPLELKLLTLCGDHPALIGHIPEDVLGRLSDPGLAGVLQEARDLAQQELVSAQRLVELAPPELRDLVARAALRGEFAGLESPEQALSSLCRAIRAAALDREGLEIEAAMAREPERVRELATQYEQLLQQRRALFGRP